MRSVHHSQKEESLKPSCFKTADDTWKFVVYATLFHMKIRQNPGRKRQEREEPMANEVPEAIRGSEGRDLRP